MKKLINIFVELSIAIAVAFIFSLLAPHFWLWLAVVFGLLLLWHHILEYRLLQALNPKPKQADSLINLEVFSQTVAYYRRKRKQDKRENLRLLSKLNKNIQYLPEAVIVCQQGGEILWCNQMAQQMFDFYWHKKTQKNVLNVIFYEQFKPYFQQPKKQRPLVIFTHNQRYIEIHINLYDEQTKLLIARDITEMIRLLHSRQTFLSNINHELRTPLTVLQGYLEMLAEHPNQDLFQQKALCAMQQQSQRMANLLQQLNLLAKIEDSTQQDHQWFDMSAMILSLQKEAEMLNQQKGTEHQIDFDIQPDVQVLGCEDQLQSAVSNLIYNAIKHAGKSCQIKVSFQGDGEGMRFGVQDNGVGISKIHLPHLTERFYRVDESRSNQTGGSGLGLAIVKHALEQHQSQLQIESEQGLGSDFFFVLKAKLVNQKSQN